MRFTALEVIHPQNIWDLIPRLDQGGRKDPSKLSMHHAVMNSRWTLYTYHGFRSLYSGP